MGEKFLPVLRRTLIEQGRSNAYIVNYHSLCDLGLDEAQVCASAAF